MFTTLFIHCGWISHHLNLKFCNDAVCAQLFVDIYICIKSHLDTVIYSSNQTYTLVLFVLDVHTATQFTYILQVHIDGLLFIFISKYTLNINDLLHSISLTFTRPVERVVTSVSLRVIIKLFQYQTSCGLT